MLQKRIWSFISTRVIYWFGWEFLLTSNSFGTRNWDLRNFKIGKGWVGRIGGLDYYQNLKARVLRKILKGLILRNWKGLGRRFL